MSTTEAWRTEAAAKIQKRHWDVIQEQAEQASEYLDWLRIAATKEQHARSDDYARRIRAAMNTALDRLERLDAIREMRDIYEIPVSED
jgi:adenylosuccinate lyase